MNKPIEISAKLILLGDINVGKSSLITYHFEKSYVENQPNTIGAAFQTDVINDKINKKLLRLNVWDTCGMEKFMAINSIYCRDANIVLLVIDAVCEDSLETAENYFINLKDVAVDDPEVILVVNKLDLLKGYHSNCKLDESLYQTCHFYNQIIRFAAQNKIEKIFWTSPKEKGLNIDELFDYVVFILLNGKVKTIRENQQMTGQSSTFLITENDLQNRRWWCCV